MKEYDFSELFPEIRRIRHELHMIPELSMEETATKKFLMDYLAAHTDCAVHEGENWFCAIFSPEMSGPGIAFRAELDALPMEETLPLPYASTHPGISHKCGHDGHMAVLAGLALMLNKIKPDRTVCLMFQHGEEIGAGGKECARFLKGSGVSEVYAFHNLSGYPEGSVILREGLTQPASEGLICRFTGKSSHASEPENGRNPASALAETALFVESLNHLIEENMQMGIPGSFHGTAFSTIVGMTAGTGDFGISAGEGSLSLTLRAEDETDLRAMEKKIIARAAELAEKYGLQYSYERRDYFPETRNDATALSRVRESAKACCLPLIEKPDIWRASEDFGYYTKLIPGAMFYIGNGEDYPPVHTSAFDFNDRIIETALTLFSALVYTEHDR